MARSALRRESEALDVLASEVLGWIRGIGRRTDIAVGRVDVIANFAQGFAFGALGHHGTRDVDADPSAIAHGIEQHRAVVPDLLDVATRVRLVAPLPTAAEAGHPLQEILIGDRVAIYLLDPRR